MPADHTTEFGQGGATSMVCGADKILPSYVRFHLSQCCVLPVLKTRFPFQQTTVVAETNKVKKNVGSDSQCRVKLIKLSPRKILEVEVTLGKFYFMSSKQPGRKKLLEHIWCIYFKIKNIMYILEYFAQLTGTTIPWLNIFKIWNS